MWQRVLVEGLNLVKRHTKGMSADQPGGIVTKEAPVSHDLVFQSRLVLCKLCVTVNAWEIGCRQAEGHASISLPLISRTWHL